MEADTKIIVIGLVIEIIGAFFLSVEAIKLKNFRSIREKFFKQINHSTASPRIVMVRDDDDPEERAQRFRDAEIFNAGIWGARHPALFIMLHHIAGAIVLVVVDYFLGWYLLQSASSGFEWALSLDWYFTLLVLLSALIFGGIVGLWMLGEIVHVAITYATSIPIEIVNFIDERTASGVVGMIGFLLLFTGGAIQIIGTIIGG